MLWAGSACMDNLVGISILMMKSMGFLGLLQKEKLLGSSIHDSIALNQWSGKLV
jgi:hypothetical protein